MESSAYETALKELLDQHDDATKRLNEVIAELNGLDIRLTELRKANAIGNTDEPSDILVTIPSSYAKRD